MPEETTPGVHVQEVRDADTPVVAASTSVAAFVGVTEHGPLHEPTLVTSWEAAVDLFGGGSAGYLPQAVHGFFVNGGGAAVVVRVLGAETIQLALGALESVEQVSMLVAPDLVAAHQAGELDLAGLTGAQRELVAHCERMHDRLALLDTPSTLDPAGARSWRAGVADPAFATAYWPWLQVHDAVTGGVRLVPPTGHVAGVWARSDALHGVHKAPANEVVRGAVDLQSDITRSERELMDALGINSIRRLPGQGISVWGARTLSSDPQWRYLHVRRLVAHLEESLERGLAWAVFEPNDAELWSRIRTRTADFLTAKWQQGALLGVTPAQAFYVRCDETTNSVGVVDSGQVVVEVGVAPLRSAEFMVFRLALGAGGVERQPAPGSTRND